jgi:hypothetical protein
MHSSSGQSIEGMTVNERLVHFRLLDEFGAAIRSRDADLGISILQRAKFTLQQATSTVTTVLSDPERYGY